jgi:hypothetical protein
MSISPDGKDWTWVLSTPCPECGFDAAKVDVVDTGGLVRANAAAWPALLDAPMAAQRSRPDRWSTLEYACHVRDVFDLFDTRLTLMLNEDGPHFANWDQDETAVLDRYGEQDPTTVSAELLAAAEEIAQRWDTVSGDQWQRTGYRSDVAAFTVESFARYFLHDPIHHLWDVGGPAA